MKPFILFSLVIVFSYFTGQSQTLYFEDFSDEANGAISGTAVGGTWTTTTPSGGAASFSKQTYTTRAICFPIDLELFQINQSGTEGVWTSSIVDISGTGQASVSISLGSGTTVASNYVRAYYKLDGGPEILFGEVYGGAINLGAVSSVILAGNDVQIVVRGLENTAGSRGACFGNDLNAMGFDDVEVTGIQTLYSRNGGGDWNTNGTWSNIALNGASCSCTPNDLLNVVIGNNDVVTLSAAATAANITVQDNGTVQWLTNNVALTAARGGSVTVANTASINLNGNAGAQLIFPAAAPVALTVTSSNVNALSVGDIVVSAAAALTIGGTGNITLADDFSVTAAATITNNLTGTFAIGDALTNSAGGALITNAGTMTIGGITTITNPSTFINNSTVTMSSTGGAGSLLGTGTWTQGVNSILNYAGGTPSITTLNASATGNRVNYSRTGVATIRNPSGSTYYHLTISGLNTKTSSADHIVAGDLLISGSGSASLNPSTFNFTVNGTTTIAGGSFNDLSDAGVNTFVGNVSVGAGTSFISNTVATTGNIIFRGGIANEGTFTAGGATFNTNNQAITGTSAMSFANNVAINGFTVTNSNTGALTITGSTTLTNGGYTDNNNTGITIFGGLVSQTGTSSFNTTAVTTAANLIFRGGITNNGGTFVAGAATFNTNNQALSGNSAMSFANVIDISSVVVTNNSTGGVSLTSNGSSLTGAGTWTQGAGGILNFAGSLIAVTTFNTTNAGNTVNYNSTGTAQVIRIPTTAAGYVNLTLNNTFATAPQFSTTGAVTATGVLTMTSGIVSLGGVFTLGSTGAASTLTRTASTTTNWMYGAGFRRFWPTGQTPTPTGNSYGLFPLGHSTASSYRPVQITAGSNISTAGSVTFTHTNSTTSTNLTAPIVESIDRKHNSQFVGSTATIVGGTPYAISVTMTNLTAGVLGNIRLAVSNAATTVIVVGTHVAATGTATNPTARRSGLSVANLTGDFRISSIDIAATPLPIKLLYFHANLHGDAVETTWATAQELNNDFFTIEKSLNPEQGFQPVLKVSSQGNSNMKQEYYAVDKAPYAGLSYYRLKQTDFDGNYTYSDLVAVNYEGSTLPSLSVYPNPLKQKQSIKVEITGLMGMTEVPLMIYNSIGQKIVDEAVEVSQSGMVQKEYFFENPLSAGVFIVKAGPTLQLTQRLVVE